MITFYRKSLKDEKLETIKGYQKGCWVSVVEPSHKEMEFLSEQMGLEIGHIHDALDAYESPRIEIEGKDTYIFLRFPYIGQTAVHTTPILFILAQDSVITVVKEEKGLFDDFISEKTKIYTTQKTKFLIYMFSKINSLYRSYLTMLDKNIWSRRERLDKISDKDVVDFVKWEEVLNDFINALVPASSLYKSLLSKQYIKFFEEDKDLVEDVMLGNDETIDISKTKIKAIADLRNAYSTIMTNNLNKTIKLLTAITIIFTIPTTMASIYGMNIALPFQQHPAAFLLVLGFTVVVSLLVFILFYKKDWI